jgi:predicted AAA+ superfamily ATPase
VAGMIIRHAYVEKITAYIDSPFVKILSGVRRSGKSTILKMVADNLRERGIPAIHLHEYTLDEAYTIIKDIYNSTIFTDIVKRNQIRKVDQLERIVRFAFYNVGRTFSANSISKYLKSEHRSIDNETVYSYLSKLVDAFILYRTARSISWRRVKRTGCIFR